MHSAKLLIAAAVLATQAYAQSADTSAPTSDVFKKVTDSSHVSVAGSDVFRRAAQARDAAQGRPDEIATDPNQVEEKVVRREKVDFMDRAPATRTVAPAAAAPAAPATPQSPALTALGAAFTSAPVETPKVSHTEPAAPKAHKAVAAKPKVTAPAAEPPPAPVERATVVSSGAAPAIARMGAAPPPPPQPVFGDTMTTVDREAIAVRQDVAPRYTQEKVTIDSVRDAHNAKLDSLEATESTLPDSGQRKFLHKLAEAARLKGAKPQRDSASQRQAP